MKKITDKMRLDWLADNRRPNDTYLRYLDDHYTVRLHGKVLGRFFELRPAIDFAMRYRSKGK